MARPPIEVERVPTAAVDPRSSELEDRQLLSQVASCGSPRRDGRPRLVARDLGRSDADDSEIRLQLTLAAPPRAETWDLLDEDPAPAASYWEAVRRWGVENADVVGGGRRPEAADPSTGASQSPGYEVSPGL